MASLSSPPAPLGPGARNKQHHALPHHHPHQPLRPAFHVAPQTGWINDPNGPLLAPDGAYHLFYQHVPNSSEWQWGLEWGHARSEDMVHWQHLPSAITPTPGSLDQHGCFSGCATLDLDGTPTIMYTGVVRKPPHLVEPAISPQHESQLLAVPADPADPELKRWVKLPGGSFLPQPPADMDLTGWRDPFLIERPAAAAGGGGNSFFYLMVGAGVRGKCGTALVYRSRNLRGGWEYVGPLCESPSSAMWECPVLAALSSAPPHHSAASAAARHNPAAHVRRHMLCVSPDYCANVPVYWLGDYAAGRFDLASAEGPAPLDLGDILYAPQLLEDKHGRTVLWAWAQEKRQRPPGTYDSACCLCVPRVLSLSSDGGKRLLQEPLPELALLRQPHGAWHAGVASGPGAPPVPLPPGVAVGVGRGAAGCASGGSHLDMKLSLLRGAADSVALLLHPLAAGAAGAAVAYCWRTDTLQVVHSTDLATLERVAALPVERPPHQKLPEPSPAERSAAAAAKAARGLPARCGGALGGGPGRGDAPISLRVLVDGSMVEVFTSSGHALATRVYRGDEPPLDAPPPARPAAAAAAAGAPLELVAFGRGPAQLLSGSVWAMANMWRSDEAAVAAAAAAAATAKVLQGLAAAEAAATAAAAPAALQVGELSDALPAPPVSVEAA